MISVGIDLAALEKNTTGFCVIYFRDIETKHFDEILQTIEHIVIEDIYTDIDILGRIDVIKPDIISIDAPFSVAHDIWRKSEMQLLARGFRPISTKLENMRKLVVRAIQLNNSLKNQSFIEVFSKSIEKQLKMDKDYLIGTLRTRIEKRGKWNKGKITKDQYDALLCSLCGLLHKKGLTETLGNQYDKFDQIIIPKELPLKDSNLA